MNRKIVLAALIALSSCATKQAARPTAPSPAPFTPTLARVTSVNTELKFVVLDFSGRPLPPVGTRLIVYRGDKLIGELETTEPMRGRFTTADILKGEIRAGDEAR